MRLCSPRKRDVAFPNDSVNNRNVTFASFITLSAALSFLSPRAAEKQRPSRKQETNTVFVASGMLVVSQRIQKCKVLVNVHKNKGDLTL